MVWKGENELIQWFIEQRIPPELRIERYPPELGYIRNYRVTNPYEGYFDLRVEAEKEVWIVEAEKSGNFVPLGQLLYYKFLYERRLDMKLETKPFRLICVCLDAAAYLEFFKQYNIELVARR
jgi:hypothetical protein